jgi:polysaccharide biosynthesis/export protein
MRKFLTEASSKRAFPWPQPQACRQAAHSVPTSGPHAWFHVAWLIIALLIATSATSVHAREGSTPVPDYRISPEDVIEIAVWKEPDLVREVVVRPDGGISFPLVGDVKAAGLTPAELEESVRSGLERFIPDAVVTVSVLELKGLRVYVTGQVRNPGQFLVGRYVDVIQAITLAGGFTPFADRRNVQIIRRVGPRETVFEFNYREIERGVNMSQNIMLQADDVVLVP